MSEEEYTRKVRFATVRIGQTFKPVGEHTLFVRIHAMADNSNAQQVGKRIYEEFLPDDQVLILERKKG